MKYKMFQVLIDSVNPKKEDIEKVYNIGKSKFEYGNELYSIEKEMIERQYLWLYCQYENSRLYSDTVYDKTKEEEVKNPRNRAQIELRKQLFIIIDIEREYVYMNDMNKRLFLKAYIKDSIQKDVIIKNIYSSLNDFQESVKYLKSVSFIQSKNVMNLLEPDSIFLKQSNALGLDMPEKIKMKIEYDNNIIGNIKEGLQNLKQKREAGNFEEIILVGIDDHGIEESFNFSSVIKSIIIYPIKDEDARYNPDNVKMLFINEVKKINV